MEQPVTINVLIEVAYSLNDDWRNLGRRLGLLQEVRTIEADYRGDVLEQAYRMLITWKQRDSGRATYQALALALRSVGKRALAEEHCEKTQTCRQSHELVDLKNGPLSEDDLDGIADNLGRKWLWAGRLLGLDESSLDEIQSGTNQLKERSYRMLDTWRSKEGSSVTYKSLSQALLHKVVQRQDIVEKYCQQQREANGKSVDQQVLGTLEDEMKHLTVKSNKASLDSVPGDSSDGKSDTVQRKARCLPEDCVKRKLISSSPFAVFKELKIKLDPKCDSGDFRDLAEKFGCNMDKIWFFESKESPTEALLTDISPRCSIGELCDNLELIGRSDAVEVVESKLDCECVCCVGS